MGLATKLKIYISDFFTKGHQRTVEAKKNIAASLFIKGISIAINLALVPLTINYVNPTQYGIWLTLSSIVAWFSFFDIGFGHGLRNRFAEAKATGNFEKARIYVSTTYAVLTLIFSLVWVFFFVGNYWIDWTKILNTPPKMALELSTLAIIVFSFFCIQIVLKTINTIIIADQRPAKAAFFDMLGQLISLIIIYILTKKTQGSLIYLGLSFGLAPVLILITSSIWLFSTKYKYFRPSFKYFQFAAISDIIKLGSKFFLIQISVIVIYQMNNLLIAHIGNPEDVTAYNIANKYLGTVVMIFSIIMTPFWSSFTEAFAKKDIAWMKSTKLRLNTISYYGIIGVIIFASISKFIYKLWIGDTVTIPISLTFYVSIFTILQILIWLNTPILNGIGKIKIQIISYSLAVFFHIPLSLLLGSKIGIGGVIISSSIFYVTIIYLTSRQVRLILDGNAKGIWNQ
ncbi:MAG: hypothetical protein JZU47_04485 [Prolixibacteraceae bacterium]|nr:hypothetical protein [Prolixibacteraceae bacterium]